MQLAAWRIGKTAEAPAMPVHRSLWGIVAGYDAHASCIAPCACFYDFLLEREHSASSKEQWSGETG